MNTTLQRPITRSFLVAGALVASATACGDDTSSSDASASTLAPSAPGVVVATPPDSARDDGDTAANATDDRAVEIVTATSFGEDGSFGAFEVAAGAALLGCSSGSFADILLPYGIFRTFACEDGERNGEFHVLFNELEGAAGPGELNGPPS